MEKNLIAKSKEWASKYIGSHQDTASESFLAGAMTAAPAIEQWETAFESCNQERKEYGDALDSANAQYSELQKKYESLLGASSLLI